MKKISAIFLMFFIIVIAGVCASAAEFDVERTSFVSATAHSEYVGDQIVMTDGNEGYSFELLEGLNPYGLTLSSDGALTGTPTSSGFYPSMFVRISHGTENRVVQFSIYVAPVPIYVHITAGTYLYDGEEHSVQTTCTDKKGNPVDVTPYIKYGTQITTGVTDAGEYSITAYPPSGYSIIKPVTGDNLLIIQALKVSELSVTDYTVDYDGSPHPLPDSCVTVDPAEAGYRVEYRSSDSSSYTTTPPTASGRYTVQVHTTNPNYETEYATATLTIVAQGVHFTVNGNSNTVEYDGNPHYIEYNSDVPEATYTVTYTDSNNNTVAEPTNAGIYTAHITFTDSARYAVASIDSATLTITPKQITFTSDAAEYQYDGTSKTPVITPTQTLPSPVGFDVYYSKQGEENPPELTSLKDVGVYDVNITITNGNGNYAVSSDSVSEIEIKGTTVNFNVTNYDGIYYDSTAHYATVTPDIEGFSDYTVSYKDSSENTIDDPTDAGTYTINITLTDDGYSLGNIDHTTLTISALPLTFTVTNNVYDYDGNEHTATVEAHDNNSNLISASGVYSVQYRDNEGTLTNGATNAGEYNVVITLLSNNYTRADSDTFMLTINAQTVNFNVTDYDGIYYDSTAHHATVTPDIEGFSDYEVKYKNSAENYVTDPTDADTYTIEIVPGSGYTLGTVDHTTLTILAQPLTFSVSDNSYDYDGDAHTATVVARNNNNDVVAASGVYTVQYRKDSDPAADDATNAGVYDIIITVTNSNYTRADSDAFTLTITSQTVNFTVTDYDNIYYDGDPHYVTATPDVENFTDYTVTYTNSDGTDVADPTDADTYTVTITLTDNGYTLGTVDHTTLTISPVTVYFTVWDNDIDYDGTAHTAMIDLDHTDPSGRTFPVSIYDVKYKKRGDESAQEISSVEEVGVYDIIITFSSPNYVLDENFNGIMTINATTNFPYGNSPAAMIYLDNNHKDDTEWQTTALNYLINDRHFNEDYVPAGCNKDIVYPIVNDNQGLPFDFDIDPHTVIVKNLEDFEDPGLILNGVKIEGTIQASDLIDGLYMVDYEHYSRYLVVIGKKIGDTNNSGTVNAIDANVIDSLTDDTPTTIEQARSWDVNKDGLLNSQDSNAILGRFRNPLVPYYPWI